MPCKEAFEREVVIKFTWKQVIMVCMLSPLIVGIGWWVWSFPWGDDGAPAWAQAIGSVGAIFVAVLIANAQHRREQLEIKRQAYERNVGLATRLRFVVYQLFLAVDDLNRQLMAGAKLPENISLGFMSTFNRLNQNFDDDLSVERIEMLTGIRHDMAIIVRVLSDPIMTHEGLSASLIERGSNIQGHLCKADAHLEAVSASVNN